MILAELSFGQTVGASFLNAIFTALVVIIVGGLVVRSFEAKAASRRQADEAAAAEERRKADEIFSERLKGRELEYQTRATLRETYFQLLVAQRRSREASLRLAVAKKGNVDEVLGAHDEFINMYHRLNLDATEEMWRDARSLRGVLDKMREYALAGNGDACQGLIETARHARQNLERSLRVRLGNTTLQARKDVGEYDRGGTP